MRHGLIIPYGQRKKPGWLVDPVKKKRFATIVKETWKEPRSGIQGKGSTAGVQAGTNNN